MKDLCGLAGVGSEPGSVNCSVLASNGVSTDMNDQSQMSEYHQLTRV